ncbi:MAG: D-tyrosyl-tRNA(Tyr) deacylase [Spirochaetales bacterium]|nr:D-tyrosyl-tRNA(Tyr) deacylase [Spirochaetales bacterium]
MKALVQRVSEASVSVNGQIVGQIAAGLLVYVGLEKADQDADLEWLGRKVLGMRVFADEAGKMNLPLGERGLLLVSQFTHTGDLRRGQRPGFDSAMSVSQARIWWPRVISFFQTRHHQVATGEFQADMKVASINDGPATFWLDSYSRTADKSFSASSFDNP